MNREEINNKMDEIYADKIGRMAERCGFIVCSDLLMPEIERTKGEMNLHLAQCMSQQKQIGQLNANRETSERTINELMAQREQLRAQLAERDKELKVLRECNSHNFDEGVRMLAAGNTMKEQLSLAKETIADFRAALKFYADKDCYVWHQYNLGTLIDHDKGKRAIEALAASAKGV